MSRLIVVSNRVPSLVDGKCSGGLAIALKAALEESGGTWLGWSGQVVEQSDPLATLNTAGEIRLATINLSQQEFHGYYEQHANRGLWPLFHGRLDLTSFNHESYALYRKVNRRFASAIVRSLGHDDVIWVHDYHLVPLGLKLRRLGVTAPIGFFLHIPFPPPETLAALPWHRELLEELSAYDIVGFQTAGCVRNFNEARERHLSIGRNPGRMERSDRLARVGCYPIGIDTSAFAALAASPKARRWCDRYTACMQGRIWAVGVERLDYTKGLSKRFLALEAFFDQWPELQGRLSLMQVAAPSRETVAEYQEMQTKLEALSGRINARLGSFDWTPIRYLNRSFNHTQLAALYRVARIGLVTPLRDGMNLVAKEYIAAQDSEDPGVLVLSRFAGAAEELTDALLVNPYDTVDVARALRAALVMPLEERQMRWTRMMQHLERYDVHHWCQVFLRALGAVHRPTPIAAAVA